MQHEHASDDPRRRFRRPRAPRGRGATSRRVSRAGAARARGTRGGGPSAEPPAARRRRTHGRGRCTGRCRQRARTGARPRRHVVALVLDTGPILALLDAGDPAHERSVAMIENVREDLVVPTCVLVEVDYWTRKLLGTETWDVFVEDVADGAYRLEPLTLGDL